MIELILNGVSIDLSDNQDFALSFAASKLQDIESRSGDFSTTFNIPLTSSVKLALGHINRLDSGSNTPYSQLTAQVKINNILVFDGFGNIIRVSSDLELNIYSGNSNWINAISEKLLPEIDLTDLNFTMSGANIQARRLNTSGVVYPNAYYGEFAVPGAPYSLYDFFPMVYNLRILTQIFDDIGWTIDGDLLTDPLFLKSGLPFSNPKIGTDNVIGLFDLDLNILAGSIFNTVQTYFYGYDSASINRFNAVSVPSTTTTSVGSEPIIEITDDGYYNLQGNLAGTFNGGITYSIITLKALIDGEDVFLSGTWTGTGQSFGGPNVFVKKGIYTLQHQVDTTATFITLTSGFFYCYTTANQNFSYRRNVPDGEEVVISKALPDLTQTEYIKTIVNQFNVIIESNYITKVASFNKFENIRYNKSNALDWTSKVDLTNEVEIQFESEGYGQTNWLRYEQDDNDTYIVAKDSADSSFAISNTNLELEKDLVQLPFSQSVRDAISGKQLLILPLRIETIKPRIAYVEITTDNLITLIGQSAPSQSAELFFDELTFTSLMATYYPFLISMLSSFKLAKILFKVNAIDIVNLDYRKPIFVDFHTDLNGQIRGYFYLNLIDQYNSRDTTIVELIKLN